TALSHDRSWFASPDVLPGWRVHVSTGPPGPVSVDDPVVTPVGIMANSGRPAGPDQPHMASGSGVSTMNRLRPTVAPLPGNTIGSVGAGTLLSRPRNTSSVAPERHRAPSGSVHWPYAERDRLYRRMPRA